MNKCYYGNVTTKVWVESNSRDFLYCAVEIMSANACTFAFCIIVYENTSIVYGEREIAVDEVFN